MNFSQNICYAQRYNIGFVFNATERSNHRTNRIGNDCRPAMDMQFIARPYSSGHRLINGDAFFDKKFDIFIKLFFFFFESALKNDGCREKKTNCLRV